MLFPSRLASPLAPRLYELDDLVARKNEGYAGRTPADPWANYRGATAFGLSALDSALLRFGEKHNRIAILYRGAGVDRVGESLRDSLIDAAAIALIAVELLDEGKTDAYSSGPTADKDGAADPEADSRGADQR